MNNSKHVSRILGIDYGMARLGLAISDERKLIATPLETFVAEKKTEQTAKKLAEWILNLEKTKACKIEEIVIGLPLMMSGRVGLSADEVKHFVSLLSEILPIPIHLWDERLTTVQADRSLREGNFSRKKRSKMVDTVSAAIILQNFLDLKNLKIV